MEPGSIPEATKKAVTWIKDKILHGEEIYHTTLSKLYFFFDALKGTIFNGS